MRKFVFGRIDMMKTEYKYLGRVNSPEDLKKLNENEIIDLCAEVR